MRKIVSIVCFLVMVAGVTYVAAAEKEYHIGCVFSVTGSASWLGEPERNTVEMLVKEINAAGGINGHKLVAHIEDSQGDNTRAVNAVKKLIKKNQVCAIIGPSRSGTTMAVIPVAAAGEDPPAVLCGGCGYHQSAG